MKTSRRDDHGSKLSQKRNKNYRNQSAGISSLGFVDAKPKKEKARTDGYQCLNTNIQQMLTAFSEEKRGPKLHNQAAQVLELVLFLVKSCP